MKAPTKQFAGDKLSIEDLEKRGPGKKRTRYEDLAVKDQIVSHIKSGCPQSEAYTATGIGESTFYKWMRDDCQFFLSVRRAQAECVARNAAIINVAGQKDWRASAWYLERRSAEFMTKSEVKHEVEVDINYSQELINRMKKYEPKSGIKPKTK